MWNRGEAPRAVLIVHFEHPQLAPAGTVAAHIASGGREVMCDDRSGEVERVAVGGGGGAARTWGSQYGERRDGYA